MDLKDIIDAEDGIEVNIRFSKYMPRMIPLDEYPEHLMRWLRNHPKTQDDEPLWVSRSLRNNHKRIGYQGIRKKFIDLCINLGLKDKTLKSFRKTRATINFSKYDTGKISELMGWSYQNTELRRHEYDLQTHDDLKKAVFSDKTKTESLDVIKKERDTLVKKHKKEIKELKEKIESLETKTSEEEIDRLIKLRMKEYEKNLSSAVEKIISTPGIKKILTNYK
jgi:hypothetical protein